jgi:hypothetical protein
MPRVRNLESLPLDQLIAFAIGEAMIDGFERTAEEIVLIQGTRQFRLPHQRAALFLVGMLRGRAWYVEDDEAGSAMPTVGLPAEAGGRDEPDRWRRLATGHSIETTLDALLAFTSATGLIEGFEKDARSRAVRIQIPACTSTLSYTDAVAYLFDCVEEHVRAERGRASS